MKWPYGSEWFSLAVLSFMTFLFLVFWLISFATLSWLFSAWNCWEFLSLFEILENLFHRLCKFCYQLLFFDSWWQSNMISNFFTMLCLYFVVAAQPTVWQWNNSVSSLKLISGTVLFSDQWSFFLFTFIYTVEMDPMEQIKKQNKCFELIR